MAFTRNRPTASEFLQNSQPLIKNNFNASDDTFGIDHYAFSNTAVFNGKALAGTHKFVQMRDTTGGNGTIPLGLNGNGWETLYTSATAGIGELWIVRGGNGTGIQLTGPGTPTVTPVAGALPGGGSYSILGTTFIAGGLVLQWGVTTAPSGTHYTTTQPFNPVFPNNCFLVLTSPNITSSSHTSNGTSSVRSQTASGFVFVLNSSTSGNYTSFQWLAIGN
jgi:hypothetical protein